MVANWMGAALLALGLAAGMAAAPARAAEGAAVPSQQDWAVAKKQVELPNGQTLAFLDIGDPAKPAVLLVHGYTDSSRSWSLPAPHLAGDFRLIVVDLRGHGASEAPECCYALQDMAYDMRLLLDHLGVERASLVGHSLGSMVGQVFAQLYPERLDKLVLIASAASAAGAAGPGSWLWDNVTVLSAPIDPESQFMRDWYSNPNPVDEDFLTRARTESAAVPLHVWNGVLYELATSDYGRLSSLIRAPTLIVWGAKDSLFDAASQEALRKAMPEATFKTFDALGHNLAWEDPQAVAGEIAAFLQR